MTEDTDETPGRLRRRLHGRLVEISRTAGRQRAYEVVIDGQPAGTGTLRRRRNISDDDLEDGLIYELIVPGQTPIRLRDDERDLLTRSQRTRRKPVCANCEGPLNEHGLEGLDLGGGLRYCFDCS